MIREPLLPRDSDTKRGTELATSGPYRILIVGADMPNCASAAADGNATYFMLAGHSSGVVVVVKAVLATLKLPLTSGESARRHAGGESRFWNPRWIF